MYTILIAVYSNENNKAGSGACLFFVFLYLGWFGLTFDATSYIYCSEIFPSFMRATGVSFSVSAWLGAALVYNEVAATAFNRIGWKYDLVFVCITVVSLYPVFFMLPETKGLSLEEISQLFGDEVAIDLAHMTEEERKRLDEHLLLDNGKHSGLEGVATVYETEKV
jgi:MFS family permease